VTRKGWNVDVDIDIDIDSAARRPIVGSTSRPRPAAPDAAVPS
jgi:hypothetical protein